MQLGRGVRRESLAERGVGQQSVCELGSDEGVPACGSFECHVGKCACPRRAAAAGVLYARDEAVPCRRARQHGASEAEGNQSVVLVGAHAVATDTPTCR